MQVFQDLFKHINIQQMKGKHQKTREVQIIKTSIKRQNRHVEVVRGDRTQTKQLNINVKTIINKFLLKCYLSNELSLSDRQVYEQYKKLKANFQSTNYLFANLSQQIKDKAIGYFRSKKVVRDIIGSDRMFLENKVVMIKFLQKIAEGAQSPIYSWKELYFKNKKT